MVLIPDDSEASRKDSCCRAETEPLQEEAAEWLAEQAEICRERLIRVIKGLRL